MSRTSGKPFSVAIHTPVQMRVPSAGSPQGSEAVDAAELSRESLRRKDPVTAIALKLVMTAS